jgi:hypothetical protein
MLLASNTSEPAQLTVNASVVAENAPQTRQTTDSPRQEVSASTSRELPANLRNRSNAALPFNLTPPCPHCGRREFF